MPTLDEEVGAQEDVDVVQCVRLPQDVRLLQVGLVLVCRRVQVMPTLDVHVDGHTCLQGGEAQLHVQEGEEEAELELEAVSVTASGAPPTDYH